MLCCHKYGVFSRWVKIFLNKLSFAQIKREDLPFFPMNIFLFEFVLWHVFACRVPQVDYANGDNIFRYSEGFTGIVHSLSVGLRCRPNSAKPDCLDCQENILSGKAGIYNGKIPPLSPAAFWGSPQYYDKWHRIFEHLGARRISQKRDDFSLSVTGTKLQGCLFIAVGVPCLL
jgi:hypothetical protein